MAWVTYHFAILSLLFSLICLECALHKIIDRHLAVGFHGHSIWVGFLFRPFQDVIELLLLDALRPVEVDGDWGGLWLDIPTLIHHAGQWVQLLRLSNFILGWLEFVENGLILDSFSRYCHTFFIAPIHLRFFHSFFEALSNIPQNAFFLFMRLYF